MFKIRLVQRACVKIKRKIIFQTQNGERLLQKNCYARVKYISRLASDNFPCKIIKLHGFLGTRFKLTNASEFHTKTRMIFSKEINLCVASIFLLAVYFEHLIYNAPSY